MATPPKLEAVGLSKTFAGKAGAVVALKDVSFRVDDGGFYTVIGHSGCGKSTLLNIIAGLEEATSGSILVDGKGREDPGSDRGMVFQGYTLFPWLTVLRNIEFGPRMRGAARRERADIAEHYLKLVGLQDFANSYPKELSGGMKQRVAIARALANKPSVLLMDEPFGALDAETRESMQDLLLSIRAREKITVFFITHDIDEAILLSQRVAMMSSRPGSIVREIDIGLPYPRNAEIKLSSEFVDIKRNVVQAFKQV